jgi:[lysine-biosynthesis-protein LysW]--L-2-aminoadipate ligase
VTVAHLGVHVSASNQDRPVPELGAQNREGAGHATPVRLLAPRLRVEERQLLAAFTARGCTATLTDPTEYTVPLTSPRARATALALDRGLATAESALLAALLAQQGTVVVNRTATTRLLADRLALLRHLIVAGLPVPETTVAFGETATLRALGEVGYPARLLPVAVTAANPPAIVHDADAGEALVEHRRMLGRETLVLVQRVIPGPQVRLVVVGGSVVCAEVVPADGEYLPQDEAPVPLPPALAALGERVIDRLGSGVYEIHVVEGCCGPVVTGAGNLVDFRSVTASGHDIAGRIADFALAQLAQYQRPHQTRTTTGLETPHG